LPTENLLVLETGGLHESVIARLKEKACLCIKRTTAVAPLHQLSHILSPSSTAVTVGKKGLVERRLKTLLTFLILDLQAIQSRHIPQPVIKIRTILQPLQLVSLVKVQALKLVAGRGREECRRIVVKEVRFINWILLVLAV
jgi:hypothetical protein